MDILTKHLNKIVVTGAVAAIAVVPAAGAGAKSSSSAGLTNFHGTVVSASSASKSLKIKRPSGTTLTFRVTSTTKFERLGGGLGALRAGRSIEVKARKVDGRWTARAVEPAAAEHPNGDDDSSGGGGSDDAGADDHGSGGHGSDD
ncbi:hypothetical protein DSM104299_00794 [Baekduia alba]|uniref:DUF5666 domain-containing protein n=1 Tax=Baekduia alba TaxID=2997333 RepID=UPI0023413BAF|nr:DUF5666 domain-containing protein [Baekduia alba]WCB92109.1 hypothetical protein DSM104299_00794 [Baekduia alba]